MAGSRAYAEGFTKAPLEKAWAVGTPMTPVGYYFKYGPLPAVLEVRDQTGPWDAVGQHRELILSDGGHVIEQVTKIDKPNTITYELSDFTKIFGALVSGARADWVYKAEGSGAKIEWTYTFYAYRGRGPIVALIIKLFWGPYMKKVLPGIIAQIDSAQVDREH